MLEKYLLLTLLFFYEHLGYFLIILGISFLFLFIYGMYAQLGKPTNDGLQPHHVPGSIINPSTGLPMIGAVDSTGYTFGSGPNTHRHY